MKRRRPYHHGDLRTALITAAVKHIGERGTEHLSLRALAREIGVSPTASYRHFPSRAALLAALATEGFEALADRMVAAQSAADPHRRLLEIGVAYVEYARTDPVRYQLMFGAVLDDFSGFSALRAAGDRAYRVLEGIVAEGVAAGVLRAAPVPQLCAAAWSAVHGVAGLLISQAVAAPADDGAPALRAIRALTAEPREALERLLFGLR
jgi:AcrR family transcriptional regulator